MGEIQEITNTYRLRLLIQVKEVQELERPSRGGTEFKKDFKYTVIDRVLFNCRHHKALHQADQID